MTGLHDEVVGVARDLIRLDTTNAREPGLGNETLCAEYLADYLGGSASRPSWSPATRTGPTSSRGSPGTDADGPESLALRRAHRRRAVRPARLDAPAVRGASSTTTAGCGAAAPST